MEKFQYLRSQLRNEAYQTIEGLPLTDSNYDNAIALLQERYGQPHKIIGAYMRALWELSTPNESILSLRSILDTLESYIRGLQSLGKDETTYGELLVPMVLDKLPASTRKQIAREHGNNEWTLSALKQAIKKEIEAMQAGETDELINEGNTHTAAFLTRTRRKPPHQTRTLCCTFCKGEHKPDECPVVTTADKRYEVVVKYKLCFNCLGNHQGGARACRSRYTCRKCGSYHHTALHKEVTQSSGNKYLHEKVEGHDNEAPQVKPEKALFVNHSKAVVLKTALTDVKGSRGANCTVSILFDEGATRSFITKKWRQN